LIHTPECVLAHSLHPAAVGACQQRSRSRPQSTSLANILSRECSPRSPHSVCGSSVCAYPQWMKAQRRNPNNCRLHNCHHPQTHTPFTRPIWTIVRTHVHSFFSTSYHSLSAGSGGPNISPPPPSNPLSSEDHPNAVFFPFFDILWRQIPAKRIFVLVLRVPGLNIRYCARGCDNCVHTRPQMSAIDVTEKTFLSVCIRAIASFPKTPFFPT